jgi:hypothetical protein
MSATTIILGVIPFGHLRPLSPPNNDHQNNGKKE